MAYIDNINIPIVVIIITIIFVVIIIIIVAIIIMPAALLQAQPGIGFNSILQFHRN